MTTSTPDGFSVTSNAGGATPDDLLTSLGQAPVDPATTESADRPAEPVVEPEAKADLKADERNPDGTFRSKRSNPVERMKDATAKEAAAKRELAQATKERDEARAEAARVRAELESMHRPVSASSPTGEASTAAPNPRDLVTYPEGQFDQQYMRDVAKFEARQVYAQARAEAERELAQRSVSEQWAARLAQAKSDIPDFDARVDPQTPVSADIHPYIVRQDDGPQILLYLSEHQDEAQAIARLHPIEQIGRIGKIQARIEAALRGTARPVFRPSAAPPPIQPLGGAPTTPAPDASDDEPFEAHFKRENAREAARRR